MQKYFTGKFTSCINLQCRNALLTKFLLFRTEIIHHFHEELQLWKRRLDDVSNGKLTDSIMSYNDFESMTKNLKSSGLIQEEIDNIDLYILSKTSLSENGIEISIPLIRDTYTVKKITFLPIPNGDQILTIDYSPYIALREESYFSMTDEEYESCHKSVNILLCNFIKFEMDIFDKHSSCEISLLSQSIEHCATKPMKNEVIVIPLQKGNEYYIISGDVSHYFCENEESGIVKTTARDYLVSINLSLKFVS